MQITNVKINKVERKDRLRAFAEIVLDDEICIRSIRIIEGNDRLFVAMPSVKNSESKYNDIVFPINHESRKKIEEAILQKYNIQE